MNLNDLLTMAMRVRCPKCMKQAVLTVFFAEECGTWRLGCPLPECERVTIGVYRNSLATLCADWIEQCAGERPAIDPADQPSLPLHSTVSSKCDGAFTPPAVRFETASNGDPDLRDIVTYVDGFEQLRSKNRVIVCLHPDKVYSGDYFASDPPQWHWICQTCGETGADLLIQQPALDPQKFLSSFKLFGH